MTSSVLCVAPVLAEDVRQYLSSLAEARLLRRVVCSLAFPAGGRIAQALRLFDQLAGTRLLPRFQRRLLGGLPRGAMNCQPWSELWVRLGQVLGALDPGPAGSDWWGAALDRAASRELGGGIRLLIGREGVAFRLFETGKAAGIHCLYDLPIPHYATLREIMAAELAEFPQADSSYDSRAENMPRRLRRKDRELELADHVVVPSPFVRSSLRAIGVTDDRITILPFGCEPNPRITEAPSNRQPIVLYVGHLSLRKGTLRLLRAWKRLGAHHTYKLRLIGQLQLSRAALAEFAGLYEHIPHLPRTELSSHYASATAFVFPSAADGFGLVLNEALAHGLPLLASSHTGAPGFITQGQEGLIYPHGDDDGLAAALDRMLSRPTEIRGMGRAAYHLAQRWTWRHYRAAFGDFVMAFLSRAVRPSNSQGS